MSATGGSTPTHGESAGQSDHRLIVDIIEHSDEVRRLVQLTALRAGDDELVIAAKVTLASDKTVREAAHDIAELKARIREAVPAAQTVYIEPDVYRPDKDPAPPTDVFVLKSAN